MLKVIRCDTFGWKYVQGEYVDQPKWFIELLRRKRQIDYEFSKPKATPKKP